MKTEGPVNQGEREITHFSGQRNDDMNEIAPPGNGSLMDNDMIRSFIIWLAPRAGKMNQIARRDWLPEARG